MIFGLGDLGGWALEFLARREGLSTIIAADFREDWGTMKTHCASVGAGLEGNSKRILFEKCNVREIDATAELINKYKPDVIYSTVTLGGWLSGRSVAQAFGEKYHQTTVVWTATQCVMLSKLMEALKRSGHKAHVVNHSFPDLINPFLCKNGYPVTLGAGNLDVVVGEIRRRVSMSENVPFREVTVSLIASHSINVFGPSAPYNLKIIVGDRDITTKTDVKSFLSHRLMASPPDLGSWLNHPAIASSAVKNIMAMINDTNEFACSPSPNGLPGGYPIRISAQGAEVVLPEGVSMEEALKINMDGLRMEGVETIKDDGTIVITEKANVLIKELYEIDLKEIRFGDLDQMAQELIAIKNKLDEKYSTAQ
jgi:hypothetical protein